MLSSGAENRCSPVYLTERMHDSALKAFSLCELYRMCLCICVCMYTEFLPCFLVQLNSYVLTYD